jgi:hypothetical protein
MTARTSSIRFEIGDAGDAVGKAGAAFVEQDQSRKSGQSIEKVCPFGPFPPQLDVGNKAGHEDEIEGAVADDLIGDAQIAAPGVAGFRRDHSDPPCGPALSLAQCPACVGTFLTPRRSAVAPAYDFVNNPAQSRCGQRLQTGKRCFTNKGAAEHAA